MGYTHYWRKEKKLNKEAFKKYRADVAKVIAELEGTSPHQFASGCDYTITLVNGSAQPGTKPEVSADNVVLNGCDTDGHETFYFDRVSEGDPEDGLVFDFCKTARKPYDLAVTSCLILAKYHFPKTEVSSDGDHEDWADGLAVVNRLFPEYTIKPHSPYSTFDAMKDYYEKTKDKTFAPHIVEAWAEGRDSW